MIRRRIKISTINDKMKFIEKAITLPCEVDIKNGSKVIDAKSELGVLEINTISNNPEVIIHSTNEEYLDVFKDWIVN